MSTAQTALKAFEKAIKRAQTIAGAESDGFFRDDSIACEKRLRAAAKANPGAPWPPVEADVREWRNVIATSFADPADVAAFKRCKAAGNSDNYCFSKGDNGIGTPALGGLPTTGKVPMCALPPEDWKPFGSEAAGKKVLIEANGKAVLCELRDTMPKKANIKNGAGIDLNPAACNSLGLKPPVMVKARWRWA